MVVNKFLAEIAQVTMAGFSAEYVHLGPEAAALEAGVCRIRGSREVQLIFFYFCAFHSYYERHFTISYMHTTLTVIAIAPLFTGTLLIQAQAPSLFACL